MRESYVYSNEYLVNFIQIESSYYGGLNLIQHAHNKSEQNNISFRHHLVEFSNVIVCLSSTFSNCNTVLIGDRKSVRWLGMKIRKLFQNSLSKYCESMQDFTMLPVKIAWFNARLYHVQIFNEIGKICNEEHQKKTIPFFSALILIAVKAMNGLE